MPTTLSTRQKILKTQTNRCIAANWENVPKRRRGQSGR